MMETKLKPCPFCGGEAKLIHDFDNYFAGDNTITSTFYVRCKECQSATGAFKTIVSVRSSGEIQVFSDGSENAISAWNKRSEEVPDNA